MITLNLSFKSLPFFSTQFESCEVPISPLISFHFLSPYKFCVNSIPCCVFICYHPHVVVHRSCLNTHLYSYSLKIPSLPHQFESDNLPIWPLDVPSPFPLAGPVLTPYLVVRISLVLMPIYLLSYILARYHLQTLVISIPLLSCLHWTYPLKSPHFHPCSGIMPHLFHRWLLPFFDTLQVLSKIHPLLCVCPLSPSPLSSLDLYLDAYPVPAF